MNNITGIVLLIAMLIIAIFYFQLYHSLFRVIYFKNMFLEMIFEFLGCFILAMLTVGAILKIFKFLFGMVGGILAFILKAIFVLAVIIGMAVIIYYIAKIFIDYKNKK